jgi:hypothetical protein
MFGSGSKPMTRAASGASAAADRPAPQPTSSARPQRASNWRSARTTSMMRA